LVFHQWYDRGENSHAMTAHKISEIRAAKPLGAITGHRFLLLFLFLLGYLVFYPYLQNNVAFRIIAIAITVLCIYAVSFRGRLAIIALALAIPTVLAFFHVLGAESGPLSILYKVLALGFDAFIVVVIFRRVFFHARPNSETIFGALCIYLLVGFGFANVYWLLNTLQSHAFYFDPVMNARALPTRFDFIYYSFGTMTSLGAVGIAAMSDEARSITVIEAILGVLYLAVLIAKLMSAYRSDKVTE